MNAFDSRILLWLNQFAGRSDRFESFVALLCNCEILKGLPFVVVMWCFWLSPDEQRRTKNREIILAAVASAMAAIVLGRTLAMCLPFRLRPMFNPDLALRPHPLAYVGLRTWSAFPSDHAMLFAALATGIVFIKPALGVAAFVYALVVIDLPRVFLGLHHPTDILAGALLGVVVAWVFNRYVIRSYIAGRALRLQETRQMVFYAGLLCLSVEIMTMFQEPRELLSMVSHLSHGVR